MNLQTKRKAYALAAGALTDNCLKGDASVLGNLDSYDEVLMPGFFPDAVLADFLSTGFVADGHDWEKQVGMPMLAEVRGGNRLYTEAQFHSDADSQAVRTRCAERIGAGKAVGLSIGFTVLNADVKMFANGAALLKWAQGAGYDMSLLDADGIAACSRACAALLKCHKLYEYSVTPAPANPAAWAISAKDARPRLLGDPGSPNREGGVTLPVWAKGEYLGTYAEAYACYEAIYAVLSDLMWGPVWDCLFHEDGKSVAERIDHLSGAFSEFSGICLAVCAALLPLADQAREEGSDFEEELSAFFAPPATKGLPAGPLAGQADALRAGAEALAARAASVRELRAKDGRTLSEAGRDRLAASLASLRACADALDNTVASCAPKPAAPVGATGRRARMDLLRTLNRSRQILAGAVPE